MWPEEYLDDDRDDRENIRVILGDAVGLDGTDASGGECDRPSESPGAVWGRAILRDRLRRVACRDVFRSRCADVGEAGVEGSGGDGETGL